MVSSSSAIFNKSLMHFSLSRDCYTYSFCRIPLRRQCERDFKVQFIVHYHIWYSRLQRSWKGKGAMTPPSKLPILSSLLFCLRIYQNAISQFKKSKFCIALDFSAFVPRPFPNFRMGCISFVYNKTVYILCRFYLFFTIASRYIQYRYIIHVMSSAVAAASVSSIKFLYSLFRHHLM